MVDGQVHLPELDSIDARAIKRIVLTGCGSAYHAALMARYAYESWLRLPVEVDIEETRPIKPVPPEEPPETRKVAP